MRRWVRYCSKSQSWEGWVIVRGAVLGFADDVGVQFPAQGQVEGSAGDGFLCRDALQVAHVGVEIVAGKLAMFLSSQAAFYPQQAGVGGKFKSGPCFAWGGG